MPLTRRSPTIWHSMPGLVAAYQPVSAPDSRSSRQNIALSMSMLGRHTANDGTEPSWSRDAGWQFDAANSQYLTTGVVPENAAWTYLLRFAGVPDPLTDSAAIGTYVSSSAQIVVLYPSINVSGTYKRRYYNGDSTASLDVTPSAADGVMVIAGQSAHYNGVSDGNIPSSSPIATTTALLIGDLSPSVHQFFTGNILALAIWSRTLTAAEVWLASHQVKYCHVNQDWNAWAPVRRWFFFTPATPSGTTMFPGTAATSAATAPYDDDDWTTPNNAKANDGSYAYIDPFAAASSGPRYPNGTITTVNTTAPYDDLDWDDKAGVGADDTDYASITSGSFDTNVISYLGKAQQYGFTIPARAAITGIEVVVAKSRSVGTSCVDSCVQLLDGNGALFGNNKADGATNWPASITGITYGGAGDMWGLNTSTLTPAIVNDADFGVGIAVKSTANNVDANVDYITVKVYYNEPTFDTNDYSYLLKLSNFGFSIPAGVTVTGVKVTVERKAVGTIKDAIVKLLDGDGALQGNDKADTGTAWPTSDTATDYGGEGDTWGATVTPTVINDADFGVAIAVKADAVDSAPYIDYVSMTVYYSAGNTYNLTAVAAGVATTTTPDLARTMSMASISAAVGLTPSADLARIIAQAASAAGATATGTPTLLSMVMLAAAAAATGATSTADLARVIAQAAAANGVTVSSTADLLRIIGQAAAANAAGVTSTADLARVIAQAAAANGITVTGDADLTVATLISLAAQVLATGATSTADLARTIAHTAAASGATATNTADLARLIAQAAAITAATASSTADLLKLAGMVAAANAATVTSTADLLKLIGLAGSADAAAATSTADLARIIAVSVSVDGVSATSTADLARVMAMVATLAGIAATGDADLTVSGGLIHLAALVAAVGMTPAADLSRLIDQAGSAAAASVTPQADLSKLIGQAALASAQGNTSIADLLRLIGLAASADGATVTPAVDLLKLIGLAGSSAGVTVTPSADLLKLISLAAQADAVTTVSLAELLVAGLMEIYRRRVPDAVRVGSRGVSE